MSTTDMAPSTVANSVDQDDSSDKYDRAKALYFAKVQEGGGSILKDYYTAHEYRFRRADFIGHLQEYSQPSNARWNVSKLDAAIIFDHELQQLDVQEVRKRELAAEFDVLLPLPTTANTQSIDNFKTCPPVDGSRMTDEDQEATDDGRDAITPGGGSPRSTPGTSPLHDVPRDEQISQEAAMSEKAHDSSELPGLATPNLPKRLNSDQLVIKKAASREGMTFPRLEPADRDANSVNIPQSILGHKPGPHVTKRVSFSVDVEDYTESQDSTVVLGSFEEAKNKHQPVVAAESAIPPVTELTSDHVTKQGSKLGVATSSPGKQSLGSSPQKTFTPHTEVSSMARYGLSPPVKGKKRQHSPEISSKDAEELSSCSPVVPTAVSKPASSPKASILIQNTKKTVPQPEDLELASSPEVSIVAPNAEQIAIQSDKFEPASDIEIPAVVPSTEDIVGQSEIVEPVPKRRKSGRVVAQSEKTPLTSTVLDVAEDDTSPTTSANNTPAIETVKSTVPVPDKAQRRRESIISGKARPKTKREATEAAEELHNRLLARHNAANSGKKGRRTSRQSIKDSDPDFMPHYFSKVNFPASEKDGTTRCICGATENVDTNQAMFACEKCGVWQHFSCVYPELRADEKDGEYLETLKMPFLCSVCDSWGHREVLQQLRQREPIGE